MFSRLIRLVGGLSVIPLTGALAAITPPPSGALALRVANPDRLSGGLFSALDAAGAFGGTSAPQRARLVYADASKGKPPLVLDARVGENVRLGDDSAALPASQRGQAEPFIYRSAANPAMLLATFQDGRYSDAGAVDCGYALSTDGGLSWSRSLIPQLTSASGGTYNRATDPVSAIGPQGDLYLATLASISGAFDLGAVVVSRSTDGGANWSSPSVVFRSTTTTAAPDKEWLAVNDYATAANSGRLVVTWTNFTTSAAGVATGDNLLASVSDDRGATWGTPVAVTPSGSTDQGSQPAFLPDGSLLVAYVTFPNVNDISPLSIQCKRSTDGGRTFPATATTIVPSVTVWDDPDMRDGVFLPSLAVARGTGALFLTYTALVSGMPHVMVTRSVDSGTSWSPPVAVDDGPPGTSVMNPAVAVSADGQSVSIVFMDRRNSTVALPVVDHYAALSVDGGSTWLPNVRLTERSSDIRYAPPTSRGYMLGDYLGVAPPVSTLQPAVAIWCDTRTGDSDPYTVRFTPSATPDYSSWALARALPNTAPGYLQDTDGDGDSDYLEYLSGTNPRTADSGGNLFLRLASPTALDVDWVERADAQRLAVTDGIGSVSPAAYAAVGFRTAGAVPANLTPDQLPQVSPPAGLVWRGVRLPIDAGQAEVVARTARYSAGLPVTVSGLIAAINTRSRLINVSTRGVAGGAAGQMIVGFVVDGPKNILLRAAGPSLTAFGVSDPLPHPQLVLTTLSGTTIGTATTATSQQTAATAVQVGAFPFPSGGADVALVQTVGVGSYTAIASDSSGAAGSTLVEAYDADPSPGAPTGPRLVNLSTRGTIGTGDAAQLTAGFVVTGSEPRRVLIRAVGPTLVGFNVGGFLPDPLLTLYRSGSSTPIASNDDWEIGGSSAVIAATAQRLGAFPFNPASLDAALLVTLSPGAYTAVVSGVNGATGIALVEAYDAD
ncbi:MAG TPA: sialidase family protein [Opitutaceae bacterium]|nr:sialidase family protein [Opitutaceae bacterium]